MLILVSCEKNSGLSFKGEGNNWSVELITKHDLWGNEIQSLKITYKSENLEQLSAPDLFVESPDFLGWGVGEIEIDEKGIYYSGDVAGLDVKLHPRLK
ncbi:hypothetical protein [Psychrobacillus vulpis]|uniref:Uncharacterized protein n=1 Tax=Psychrobacillus vulpis TaxID=2325572 RepID=A0A544TNT1_9BACI|nr:hypothetical protein [Psychrobacillus vulpis]TQR19097.1 hypothetical protein FG384_13895 [Psychrobacillus vulpis]